MTNLMEDHEEDAGVRKPRPSGSARRRERKATSEMSSAADAGFMNERGTGSGYRQAMDDDELYANSLQEQVNRAPTARTKQRQLEDDELLARVIAVDEDEQFARKLQMDLASGREERSRPSRPSTAMRSQLLSAKSDGALSASYGSQPGLARDDRLADSVQSHSNLADIEAELKDSTSLSRSSGMNNLKPEDLDPNDPRRAELLAEREAAERMTALKGSISASANLSSNLRHEDEPIPVTESGSEGEEEDETDEDRSEHFVNDHPGNRIFPESTTGSDGTLQMQLQELFTFISACKPETVDLTPELKCFIPDYIPAIGDIDPIIKIPPPPRWSDTHVSVVPQDLPLLGLTVLDEPTAKQSDPAVLDLKLRAMTKTTAAPATQQVRSIQLSFSDHPSAAPGKRALAQWVQNVYDIHLHKPPDKVGYMKRMPDIEQLMAEWPPEMDRALSEGELRLPSADIDLSLPDYCRLVCNILDIPVHITPDPPSTKSGKTSANPDRNPAAHIEALHVLFTLFSEFKNSQHFGRGIGQAVGTETSGVEKEAGGGPTESSADYLKLS
ncbi:Intraflagellar transport protein 46 [Borealophlyctis nickersoniae]|nr:Intraflagellar transport protein 46 [Borealophlyctis nickersoniae]